MPRSRLARHGLTLLLAAIPIAVALGFRPQQPEGAPGAGAVPTPSGRREVHALARLEPTGGLLGIGIRPGVRVEQLKVKPGDHVAAGQPLAVLEGQAAARRQLEVAEAKRAAAVEQRDRRREALKLEREAEDAVRATRLTMLENAYRSTESFVKKLSEAVKNVPQTATLADRTALDSALEQSRTQGYRTYVELEQARASDRMLDRTRALEDRALADDAPDLTLADREIALAQAGVDATTIVAPAEGEVLEVLLDAGESSTTGLLLYMGDLSAITARAEVEQTDLGMVRAGDPAEVRIGERVVAARVTRVGRLVMPNQIYSIDPRDRQDRRVAHVEVALEDPAVAREYVNMQVEAVINPSADPEAVPSQ